MRFNSFIHYSSTFNTDGKSPHFHVFVNHRQKIAPVKKAVIYTYPSTVTENNTKR